MKLHEYFPQGIRLYTDVGHLVPPMAWQAITLRSERWEPESFALLNRVIDPRTVLLDVGAWIGVLTVFASPRAKRVIAFEPDPNAFTVLTANVTLNACSNVTCTPYAISDRNGTVILTGNPTDGRFGCSTSQTGRDMSASQGVEVPSLRLDDAVKQLCLADNERLVIKMDIEGGETLAIPASQEVWQREAAPILFLSLHGKLVTDARVLSRVLDHLVLYYGADSMRIVSWEAEKRQLRLLPLTAPIASDSMDSILCAPREDLERVAQRS